MNYTDSLVDKIPQLKRGIVWCIVCGGSMEINSGDALHYGWPDCCDQAMTIDSPEERAKLEAKSEWLRRNGESYG